MTPTLGHQVLAVATFLRERGNRIQGARMNQSCLMPHESCIILTKVYLWDPSIEICSVSPRSGDFIFVLCFMSYSIVFFSFGIVGGVEPPIGEYNKENPLKKVTVIQSIYSGLLPGDIVDRVKNCNRPGGAINLTEDEAQDILREYKEAFENNWAEGYNDPNDGEIQFVLFSDDAGAIGTTGRTLRDITLDNGKLMAISIIFIALFSVVLLVSPDWIESRVLITLVGVCLVVLSFFAGLGMVILIGIKM